MDFFITGGAGFVGSHLADYLLKKGSVTVFDNLLLGTLSNIKHNLNNPQFRFIKGDLLDFEHLRKSIAGHSVVFHLAANSDISNNERTDTDLKIGTLATYNVLEAMRLNKINKIVFSSSSAIYGERLGEAIKEDDGPCLPISFYGASKLASEGLISAFCHNFNFQAWIFRFANIVGSRGTHGVLVDFIRKLKENPRELLILGDGRQSKPYLEVHDCVEGMLFGLENAGDELNYFNLTSSDSISVREIAEIVVEAMGLEGAAFKYTGRDRGWTGDVPRVRMDPSKLSALGWKPRLNSKQAVTKAAQDLVKEMCE